MRLVDKHRGRRFKRDRLQGNSGWKRDLAIGDDCQVPVLFAYRLGMLAKPSDTPRTSAISADDESTVAFGPGRRVNVTIERKAADLGSRKQMSHGAQRSRLSPAAA